MSGATTELDIPPVAAHEASPSVSETRESVPRRYHAGFKFPVCRQDRFLPVANIARIMKRVLPPNEKIAKDAKEAVQECVSEFICFVT